MHGKVAVTKDDKEKAKVKAEQIPMFHRLSSLTTMLVALSAIIMLAGTVGITLSARGLKLLTDQGQSALRVDMGTSLIGLQWATCAMLMTFAACILALSRVEETVAQEKKRAEDEEKAKNEAEK